MYGCVCAGNLIMKYGDTQGRAGADFHQLAALLQEWTRPSSHSPFHYQREVGCAALFIKEPGAAPAGCRAGDEAAAVLSRGMLGLMAVWHLPERCSSLAQKLSVHRGHELPRVPVCALVSAGQPKVPGRPGAPAGSVVILPALFGAQGLHQVCRFFLF